jgi:hypothetical protein
LSESQKFERRATFAEFEVGQQHVDATGPEPLARRLERQAGLDARAAHRQRQLHDQNESVTRWSIQLDTSKHF